MRKFLVITAIALTGAGCGPSAPTQMETLRGFWDAMLAGDRQHAVQYLAAGSDTQLPFHGRAKGDRVEFIGAKQIQDFWAVDTRLIVTRNNEQIAIPLKTILIQDIDNGRWYVDYASTRLSLYDAAFESAMNRAAKQIMTGVDVLEAAIPDASQDEAKLKGDIGKLMAELGDYLYKSMIIAADAATQKHEEVQAETVGMRRELSVKANHSQDTDPGSVQTPP